MTPPSLEDVLDSLPLGVVRLDAEHRVRYLNPFATDLLEAGVRQALGRTIDSLLPMDENLLRFLERARANREPLAVAEMEFVCGLPPGRRHLVACDIQPLDDGDVQLVLRVLDRRQLIAEESGLLHNHQAQQLLFQALAHEIKNPLAGLRGAVQLLAAEINAPEQREYLDVMLKETARLRDLVDALLGNPRAPQLSPVNIHAVLEHVLDVLRPAFDKHVDWKRDYDPSLPDLRADADQLTQVFLNIVSNAVDAIDDAGSIAIRTRIERQYTLAGRRHRMAIRIDIQDDGPGVPDSLRDTLFLPLVSGRKDGSGLGLAIAQDIVRRHGGLIEYRSRPAETTFSIILPLNMETR